MRPNKPYISRDASMKNYEHQSNRYHQRRRPFLWWFTVFNLINIVVQADGSHYTSCPAISLLKVIHMKKIQNCKTTVTITEGVMLLYVDFHV